MQSMQCSVASKVTAARLERRRRGHDRHSAAAQAGLSDAVPSSELDVPSSELDASQAAFNANTEQRAARRAVTLAHNEYMKAANARRIDEPVGRAWQSFGGDAIDRMLAHVDLVDARYLIALSEAGGIIPRWQHLPDTAKINRANIWRLWGWERMFSLGVLVLSYRAHTLRLNPRCPCLILFC